MIGGCTPTNGAQFGQFGAQAVGRDGLAAGNGLDGLGAVHQGVIGGDALPQALVADDDVGGEAFKCGCGASGGCGCDFGAELAQGVERCDELVA